jgi:hypothetical protein
MNIASNPWTFTSTDVVAAPPVPVASPNGLVQQGNVLGQPGLAAVLLTTVAAHNLVINQFITVVGTTGGRFLGLYKVIAVPSATTALLANISSPTSGQPFNTVLAGDGGGLVLINQIQQMVRIEDISLQAGPGAVQVAGELILLDRNGLLIWTAFLGATPANTGSLAQNRGKLFWVDGITWQSFPAGYTALLTIN